MRNTSNFSKSEQSLSYDTIILNAQTFLKSLAHHHFIYHPQCASNHRSVSDYIEFCYFEKAKKPW